MRSQCLFFLTNHDLVSLLSLLHSLWFGWNCYIGNFFNRCFLISLSHLVPQSCRAPLYWWKSSSSFILHNITQSSKSLDSLLNEFNLILNLKASFRFTSELRKLGKKDWSFIIDPLVPVSYTHLRAHET